MQHHKIQPKLVLASVSFIAALALSQTANAETPKIDIEPGLWQHSFSIKTASGELERAMEQLEKTLASIPAAQRKMMEKMMASQNVSFDFKNSSMQVCLTQEEIDRGQLPRQDGCEQQVNKTGANSYSFTFSCDTNPPSSGSGVMTLDGRKAYTGNASFTTQLNGKAEQMTMQQSGKWLKADCG
ncbi:DUF3617 domain-containing protein [Rheinheimera sp. D18]|uniref:DUF3617 domain-containing protein n=1 Tax=Rheinheimera sp. D18 TaxID=2545632 RepID=UPI00104503F6|nr:DUF3617 domain-containing protein [Rheinheimera sp. D18]QBL08855.1 DUF3617 domain-containing protein [Rheinheimera sp. D18]